MITQQHSVKCVLLVHGAFVDDSCWSKVILLLEEKGLITISLPAPLSSLSAGAAAVNRALDRQDSRVLLVGHCWGGAVITEAGVHPKVAGLLYIAACAPDSGESFDDWGKGYFQTHRTSEIRSYGDDGYIALTRRGIRDDLAQDLSEEDLNLLYCVQAPIAKRCYSDKITNAAWRFKPTWHIIAKNDFIIPPAAQRDSAARMAATTLTLSSSHVPMLSQPKAVASFILEAASMLDSCE